MRRLAPWLTAALQFTILFAAVTYATPWLEAREASLPTPRRLSDVALTAKRVRPIYNASVIPGGAYSADELRAAIERDPIVAAHYHNAVLGGMRAVTLTRGRAAYVSYRVNDHVYWTRERVWIKAGETVLTDGATIVRARCGNCIADAREGPVAAVEPAHGELDDFVESPAADRGVDAFAAEADGGLGDLLAVPFGPQVFAALSPALPEIGNSALPFGGAFPVPGVFVPGAANDGGVPAGSAPGIPGVPGGGIGGVPPSGESGSDAPPFVPPADFVPPDGGQTSGTPGGGTTGAPTGPTTGQPGTETSGTTGSTTSGTPGHPTTGTPADTTGPGVTPTTGIATTDGTPFPTTSVVTTVSTSHNPPEAPEPDVLWLIACGAIGLASRSWKR